MVDKYDGSTIEEKPTFYYDNTPIATLSATIGDYPQSKYRFGAPVGRVTVSFYEGREIMIITLDATNVPQGCDYFGELPANECGVHIHSGTSCVYHEVLGHYFKPQNTTDGTLLENNPWTNVRYTSSTFGSSSSENFQTVMERGNGYDAKSNQGHAIVIHSRNGARIGCGVLELDVKEVVKEDVKEDATISSLTASNSSSANYDYDALAIGIAVSSVLGMVFVFILFIFLYKREVRNTDGLKTENSIELSGMLPETFNLRRFSNEHDNVIWVE